tara:strand:+ start:5544 stop:5906 length:363 start_codon:yes stop_codon:yes gene_type:complete
MPPGGFQETAKTWDPDETEILLKERSFGTSWIDIAILLGRSRSAVRGRFSRISSEYGGGLQDFPKTKQYSQTCKVCGKKRRGHVCMVATTEMEETETSSLSSLSEWEFQFDTLEKQPFVL